MTAPDEVNEGTDPWLDVHDLIAELALPDGTDPHLTLIANVIRLWQIQRLSADQARRAIRAVLDAHERLGTAIRADVGSTDETGPGGICR